MKAFVEVVRLTNDIVTTSGCTVEDNSGTKGCELD